MKTFIFDLDGTLFHTSAEILTDGNGNPDFREFRSKRLLIKESEPNFSMLALAIEVQKEGHKVYILTARQSVIAQSIYGLLAMYDIKPEYVFCVGDRGLNVADYKAELLKELAIDDPHGKMYFYDDEQKNIEAATNLNLSNLNIYKV